MYPYYLFLRQQQYSSNPCYNNYYVKPNHYYPYYYYRPFPPVNPDLFVRSSKQMQLLIKDAEKLVNSLANSKSYSTQVMNLAQESKTKEVLNLLKSTGITNIPEVDFNPDGIFLDFSASLENTECCHLVLKLRWI